MKRSQKILLKVLKGTSDNNISFSDLKQLLEHMEFDIRIKGSHHIYTKEDVEEILNLQPKGSKAKPYQVKQVRKVIIKYKLADAE